VRRTEVSTRAIERASSDPTHAKRPNRGGNSRRKSWREGLTQGEQPLGGRGSDTEPKCRVEASKLYADALVHDKSEVSTLVNMYALIGRMRIFVDDAVVGKAEAAARMVIDTYFFPNKTFPELRLLMQSHAMDPLREFGEVCREELAALK
jgi:hypothetical protein